MKSSYQLARIKGIDVRVHFTLLILFLSPVLELSSGNTLQDGILSALYTFTFLVILFASVLAHELSHSFVAMRNKIKVRQIILTPLGGIATVGMIKDPVTELKVSIAGPLASMGIGFVLLIMLSAVIGIDGIFAALSSGDSLYELGILNLAILGMYMNFVLGAFNLFLPIFPMDGGRVLRSMLQMLTTRLTATKMAVAIGQTFLAAFVFFSISYGMWMWVAIGAFLFMTGISELKLTQISALAEGIDLRKVIKKDMISLSPEFEMKDLGRISAPQQSIYPVLDKGGRMIGYIDAGLACEGVAKDCMKTEFPLNRLTDDIDGIMLDAYTNGCTFISESDGTFYGILDIQSLQKKIGEIPKAIKKAS